jgi:FixJ family two-component response regulator
VPEEIVRGRSNKEIASALGISEATVKSHINSILSKLGVDDRTVGRHDRAPTRTHPPSLDLKRVPRLQPEF